MPSDSETLARATGRGASQSARPLSASARRSHRTAAPGGPSRRSARTGRLLVAPASLLVIAFVLFPLGYAVYISLTDFPLIGPYHFVGFANYRHLFGDPQFWRSLRFTALYTLIVTPPIFIVGYALATLLRSNRFGAKVFRTLYFLPFVVGLTSISFMFSIELQPGSGGVDFLLSKLGIVGDQHVWTYSTAGALIIISVIIVWFASGLTMLILTGGMQSIPHELYEVAEVDGAGWWTRERHITLPLLRGPIALSLIISVIGSFLAFNQFFIIAQNNTGLESIVEWIYQTGFENDHLGYATAMAIVLIVIIGLVTAVQYLALRTDTEL